MKTRASAAQDPRSEAFFERRIGVLGGTFNPPHLGHLHIAEQVYQEFGLEKVIILPVGIPPHKAKDMVLDRLLREQMCALFCKERDFLELCTMELQREGYTYTVDTLRTFWRMLQPGERIYYIIGTDTLFQLETWKEHEAVLAGDLCTFICVPRPGDGMRDVQKKVCELQQKYGVNILLSSGMGPDISSTMVREAFLAGEDVSGMVPGSVMQFMEENHVFTKA